MQQAAKISLLVPTRARPQLLRRFLESAAAAAERRDRLEAVIYADEDDPQSHGIYVEGIESHTIVGPRISMGACNMECLRRSSGDIVILANDDVVIRTESWDRRLREVDAAYADGVYLAYPNDLYKGRRLCAFPVLSRSACNMLVEPFPRIYAGAFIDYHLLDIFRRLEHAGERRIRYLPDVVFEHMHFRAGKAALDDTYRQRHRFRDDEAFLSLRDSRSSAAEVLLAAIRRSARGQPRLSPRSIAATGMLAKLAAAARTILADRELPLQWRGYLFVWFVGRILAAEGYLPGGR
jgi:hypothetical protein